MTVGSNTSGHLFDTSFTTDGVLYSAANGVITSTSAGTSGQVLTSNGAGVAPTYQAVSASGAVTQVNGDSGSATPSAGVITVKAGLSTQNSGLASLTASGSTVTLNLTDTTTFNTILGASSGNATRTGTNNVGVGQTSYIGLTSGSNNSALGDTALSGVTSGQKNVAVGSAAGGSITTGSYNICIGERAGSAYTSSESSNIIIGSNLSGTASESNVIRIGAQGSGSEQQNACYVAGIAGVTVSNPTLVTQNSSTNQLGTVPYTAFTTYSPAVAFGGGSTGITYSTQNGGYFLIGSLVWFYIDLHLSSKGSSTGNATITLPLSVNASIGSVDFVWYAVLGSFAAGTTYCVAETSGSGTTLALYQVNGSTGAASNITNSTFGGTDFLRISGCYLH